MIAYAASKIFTSTNWLDDHAVLTADGIITGIVPVTRIPVNYAVRDFGNTSIVPAFIDLQIYGAGGKLFSAYPGTEALQQLEKYCAEGGAAYCLPAIATNSKKVVYDAIDAIRNYWEQGGKGILGLHLEGPWINPLKRGAHIEALIERPGLSKVKELLAYGKGVIKMITLAPEVCTREIIECIRSAGIILSAGHSNASYAEAMQGFRYGINAVTHLFNAMSGLQHRAPGLAGAAMDDDKAMVSIIPDGYHVDFAAVRIAKAVIKDRLFVITDAVTATGEGYYQHQKENDKYTSEGILSGSSLNMQQALKNLIDEVKIDAGEALRMCSTYPATLLAPAYKLGKIEQGYEAAMLVLDKDFTVRELIRD